MASPSKNVFDHVRFQAGLGSHLLCEICDNPFLDAEMATPCGHSFCGFCVNKFRTHGTDKTCQKCGTNVTGFCRNLLANSVLEREEGECVYCHEKFTLDKAKDHVRRCVLFPVDCSFCRQPVKRKDLQQHMEGCPFGDVVCACGLTIKRKDQESHVATTCPFREEPCPLKCGDSVKRLLIPTHSLRCSAVATECSVKGCHSIVRKRDVPSHISKDQMRHFSLLEEEKRNILWEVQKKVLLDTRTKTTGEVGVFQWKIPTRPRGLVCSPEFNKFDRKWRLLLNDKAVALEFSQGVKPIHMDLSFIVKSSDGKIHAYILRAVELAEGTMATHTVKMPMDNVKKVTAKLELLEPQIN